MSKKIISLFLIVIMAVVFLFPTSVMAEQEEVLLAEQESEEQEIILDKADEYQPEELLDSDHIQPEELPAYILEKEITMGTTCEGELTDRGGTGILAQDDYRFTLEQPGRVYIHNVSFDSQTAPAGTMSSDYYDLYLGNRYYDLKAGSYTFSVCAYTEEEGQNWLSPFHSGSQLGHYSFTIDFEPIAVDDVKDLEFDRTYTGMLEEYDEVGCFAVYTFTLPEDGAIDLEVCSWVPEHNYDLEQYRTKVAYDVSGWNRMMVNDDYDISADFALEHHDRLVLKKGSHTLRINSRGIASLFTIKLSRVKQKPVKVTINKAKLTIPNKNVNTRNYPNQYELEATVVYKDGKTVTDNRLFNWTSSNTSVLNVDQRVLSYFEGGEPYFLNAIMRGTSTVTASAIENPSLTVDCEVKVVFADVYDPAKYYYKPVYWAVKKGYAEGSSWWNYFGVGNGCKRVQFVIMLWKMAGCPKASTSVLKKFNDVSDYTKGRTAIAWAVQNGIIQGYKDGRFDPYAYVNRKQAVLMLYRFAGKPKVSGTLKFTDTPYKKTSESYRAILWATQKKITNGKSATRFAPDEKCVRGQIVTFLYRYKH